MNRVEIIERITNIVNEWGSFSISEVDGAECPVLWKPNKESEALIEVINIHDVNCTEYINGIEQVNYDVQYMKLTDEQLEDVLLIAENFEAEQIKTFKRCKS